MASRKRKATPVDDPTVVPVAQLAIDLGSLTTSMTIEEVGQALYQRIYNEKDKIGHFSKLNPDQKGMLVVYLTHIGFSPVAIADNLGVQQDYVLRAWEQYADRLGQHVMGIRLQTLVGDLKSKADRLYEQAIRDGKPQLAWKITTEFVGVLQDLNIVERAAQKTEVTHKMSLDESDLSEIDELVKLRKKKLEAQERQAITLVTERSDPLPEEDHLD